jgi:glutamyl-tRNA synthetase
MPDTPITFADELRGELTVDGATLHDQVLARSDRSPLYNLAVVVDDHHSAVTHVIRGDDHISNTFKQVAIASALGYEPARYAHLPLVHDEHGKKYSKRHEAPSVLDFRDQGYTAQTMRNALALLGWGPRDNQELLSDAELISRFDLADCGTQAARLDPAKVRWISGQKLRALTPEDYAGELAAFTGRPVDDRLTLAAAGAQEKASTLAEAWAYVAWAFTGPAADDKAWRKTMKGDAAAYLHACRGALETVAWEQDAIAAALEARVPDGVGAGKVYQPLRVALSGSTVTTAIEHTVLLAGRDNALARIDAARARLAA